MLALTLNLARRHAWSIAMVAGLSACSAQTEDRFGPGQTEVRALVDDHCGSVAACACAGELVEEGCADDLDARWEERRVMAQNSGLTYDAECFAALTTQIQDYDCYWPGGTSPLCESFCAVFHGDKAVGESCGAYDNQASDCAQGLVCSEGACAEPCAVLVGRGHNERCAQPEFGQVFDDCAEGLFCSWDTGICLTLAQQGESCRTKACAPGLDCSWQTDTCEIAATEGESCNNRPCAQGHYCEWVEDGGIEGQQVCRAYAQSGESCQGRPCDDELWCGDGDRCIAAPGEGQPCLFSSICEEGLVCTDFDAGTCVAPPEAGAPCVQNECATGSWCETTPDDPVGVCAVAQPTGEMCSGHRQCQSNYCPNGFCWEAPLAGESCAGANVCAPGLVCNGEICEGTTTRAPAVCSYPGW